MEKPPLVRLTGCNSWADTITMRTAAAAGVTERMLTTREAQSMTATTATKTLTGLPAVRLLEKTMLTLTSQCATVNEIGQHTQMYEYVTRAYLNTDERGKVKHEGIRKVSASLKRWSAVAPATVTRVAFCPAAGQPPSSMDVLHPEQVRAGGYMIMSDTQENGYIYIGVSSNLAHRFETHQMTMRRMFNTGKVYDPSSVDFFSDCEAMYKVMAAALQKGTRPILMTLFEMTALPPSMLEGDTRPWDTILTDMHTHFGTPLGHKISCSMKKNESALMNRFRSNALLYNCHTDAWSTAPLRKDGRRPMNASTVQKQWDKLKGSERRSHKRLRRSMPTSTSATTLHLTTEFQPTAHASMAMRTFSALFMHTTGPFMVGGKRAKIRALPCERQSDTATAATAFLKALPQRTARDLRQLILHASANTVLPGLTLTANTTALMMRRLNVRLRMKDVRPIAVLHHLDPSCNNIDAKAFQKSLHEAARKVGTQLPADLTFNLRLFWSFAPPLRLSMFNHAANNTEKDIDSTCHCHLFPMTFKKAIDNVAGIQPGSYHVATNKNEILEALETLGANAAAIESLLTKLRMGARARLLEENNGGLHTAMTAGVLSFLQNQIRGGALDGSINLEQLAKATATLLVHHTQTEKNEDNHTAMPTLTQAERKVHQLLCLLLTISEAEKDSNAIGSCCKRLYHQAILQELDSSHYCLVGKTSSAVAQATATEIADFLNEYKVIVRYHKAASTKKAKQKQHANETLGKPPPKPRTAPSWARFRANPKIQGDVFKLRFISNPEGTMYYSACRLVVAAQRQMWPETQTTFERQFDNPPNNYTPTEAAHLATLKRKPWTVWSTEEALVTVNKLLKKLNAFGVNPEEPPMILAKDFSRMFETLNHGFTCKAHKHSLNMLPAITHLLIETEYGPLKYTVTKLDRAGAHSAYKRQAHQKSGVSLLSVAEYHLLYCWLCTHSHTSYAGQLYRQTFGVAMGLPCSPEFSTGTLVWFEMLFVQECIEKKAFNLLEQTDCTFLSMDDMLTAGSTLSTHTYLEDIHSSVEDSTPGQPPRTVEMPGIYPRGGLCGLPPQLLFNVEHDFRKKPCFRTDYTHEVPALDFAVKMLHGKTGAKPMLTLGSHNKLRMMKSRSTTYLPFTSATSNVRASAKQGLLLGEVPRLFRTTHMLGEFAANVAHRQLQLYLQGVRHSGMIDRTNAALWKLRDEFKNRWKVTPKVVANKIKIRLLRFWLEGSELLDVRNACQNNCGPQNRPLSAPGDDEPLTDVDPDLCKAETQRWDAASPHGLCATSWRPVTVMFQTLAASARACVKYNDDGSLENPKGGFVHNNRRRFLHAPVTGQVMFLRKRGSTETGHEMYYGM